MGKVIIGFTMPLDGFLNDQNGSVERLYPYPRYVAICKVSSSDREDRRRGPGAKDLCQE